MHQGEDCTMGYFLKHKQFERPPVCGQLSSRFKVNILHCLEKAQYFFCEKEEAPEAPEETSTGESEISGIRHIQLSNPRNFSVPFTHAVCPSGHWTHEFLACDIQSACWADDDAGQSSGSETRSLTSRCQSPLSELFTCRNGLEHVPYSLVCDHSRDCLDFSDEDFCVHPPCSASWQFECNNRQVRHTPVFTCFLAALRPAICAEYLRDFSFFHGAILK